MDEIDRKLLTETEKGLTLTESPFNKIAQDLGITPKEVIARLAQLKERGVIRRFGASIKPNNIGFSANAMIAWKIPAERITEIGDYLSKLQEISHCYERKAVDGQWEYNLYTVMHAKQRKDVECMVNAISKEIGISDHQILYSTRDLRRANFSLENDNVTLAKTSVILPENDTEVADQ